MINDDKFSVGSLSKRENTILKCNQELPGKRLYSLEKKSQNIHISNNYEQQINDYIKKGYTKKLS